jgi:single-strand DNA-binding protein
MENLNVATISGNLTRDAELSYTQSGHAILKFSIAVNRRKKVGDQWQDEAHFFDIVKWKGEKLAQYLTKGKRVIVSGRMTQDRWEAQDGTKRSKVYITADHVEMVGGRDGSSERQPGPPDHADPASPQFRGEAQGDIPF